MQRIKGKKKEAPSFLAIITALALVVSCLPLNFSINENGNVKVGENKAEAIIPATPYALEFLNAAAAGAGLTGSQWLVTGIGIGTAATGVSLANSTGVKLGDDLSYNLRNLVEAADFPDYDTLEEDSKQLWGSRENYEAAKYNSLMEAFGLNGARDRFYSSGGGNFEWQDDEREKLQRLGRIGQNWVDNGSNTVSSLLAAVVNKDAFNEYLGVSNDLDISQIDSSKYPLWANVFRNGFIVSQGDLLRYKVSGNTKVQYVTYSSNEPVYWIPFIKRDNNDTTYYCIAFSKGAFSTGRQKEQFAIGIETPTVPSATDAAPMYPDGPNGEPVYATQLSYWIENAYHLSECNMRYVEVTSVPGGLYSGSETSKYLGSLLYGDSDIGLIGAIPVNVEGYPEDIAADGEQPIYMPANGVSSVNNWSNYTTEPGTGGGSGGEGSAIDYTSYLERIIALLQSIDADLNNKAASVIRELQMIYDKLSNGTGSDMPVQPWHVIVDNFPVYNTEPPILRVHDEGVYDQLTDIQNSLLDIIRILRTPDVNDVVGDFDFDALKDNAEGIVDRLSTLAPFGAFALIASMLAIWTGYYQITDPSFTVPFNFVDSGEIVINLDWMTDLQPVIDFFMISLLIWCLANASIRIIELEASS